MITTLTSYSIHRDANLLIRKFDRYVGRSVEQGASLVLDAAAVKGPESHGEYMSEGKIKPYVFYSDPVYLSTAK